MIESAKKDSYYAQLKDELTNLRNKIATNKSSDLFRFKDQITLYLEDQIAFHYGLSEGQAEVSLNRHPEIIEAKKALTSGDAYKKILNVVHSQP
jgi:carboxyl-terminal processing protease